MIKNSFPLRVLSITFIVLALPLLIDSFNFFQRSYEEAIIEAKDKLREIANFRAFALYKLLPADQQVLKEVAFILDQEERQNSTRSLEKALDSLAAVTENMDFFVFREDAEGHFTIVSSSEPEAVGQTIVSYQQFANAVKGDKRGFFRYSFSEQRGMYVPYIYMAYPLKIGENLTQQGLVVVRSAIERPLNSILTTERSERNVAFALTQGDGIVIAASNKALVGNYFDPISEERYLQIEEQETLGDITLAKEPLTVLPGKNDAFFQFIVNGQVQLAYRTTLPLIKGSLVVYLPKGTFFAQEMRTFLFVYILYGIIFIIGGVATYWITLWLARPLKQLTEVMKKVAQGNLGVRFQEERFGYEINFLGSSFNDTLNSLLDTIQRHEDERVQKETYQREINIGRTVQRNLLPTPIQPTDRVEIVGYYRFAAEVGGDFYDYTIEERSEDETLVRLSVADASGKGVSSCLYALAARSFIRSFASLQNDIEAILVKTNNAFLEDTGTTGMFVSVLMGLYSTKTGVLTYYSCGHVPGLIKRKNGEVIVLEHSGMAMGLMELDSLKPNSILLESGDFVIFYTNGIIDVTNERGVVFSLRRLVKTLEKNDWHSPNELIEGIMSEVMRFAKAPILEEETTLLVMKVL